MRLPTAENLLHKQYEPDVADEAKAAESTRRMQMRTDLICAFQRYLFKSRRAKIHGPPLCSTRCTTVDSSTPTVRRRTLTRFVHTDVSCERSMKATSRIFKKASGDLSGQRPSASCAQSTI